MTKFKQIYQEVEKILASDHSGHNMDHIERVIHLATTFAREKDVDQEVVYLAALLHDVDDYKLVGAKQAETLTTTKRLLKIADVTTFQRKEVLEIIETMGYSKSLKGIRPTTLEGQIVSDADMCDAIGASGILRAYQYSLSQQEPFFDKNIWPIEAINSAQYRTRSEGTTVCHFFEKLLLIKNLIITKEGKKEAAKRHQVMVDFLFQFFEEECVPDWQKYLTEFLEKYQA